MTIEEAKKIAENPTNGHGITDVWQALTALADALRATEGQVVAMREDAARAVDRALAEVSDGVMPVPSALTFANVVAARIRALPAPAARTYEDGVRDAVKAIRDQAIQTFGKVSTVADQYARVVESLLSPAPAVAPVAQKPGPTPPDVTEVQASLIAMADQLRHAIGNGRQHVTCADLLLALDAGVIAGRGAK